MIIILCVFVCFATTFAQNRDDEKIDLSHFGMKIYGEPINNDRNRARRFGNPEEHGPYLEGDLLTPISGRNGINLEAARWLNGVVPYEIKRGFSEFSNCLF